MARVSFATKRKHWRSLQSDIRGMLNIGQLVAGWRLSSDVCVDTWTPGHDLDTCTVEKTFQKDMADN